MDNPIEVSSDGVAGKLLDNYYQPKMHWKLVNRKNVLKAMEAYKSIGDNTLKYLQKGAKINTESILDLKLKIKAQQETIDELTKALSAIKMEILKNET